MNSFPRDLGRLLPGRLASVNRPRGVVALGGSGGASVPICVASGFVAILLLTSGCRGRAQQDLYHAKLTREIRVLEDKLYAADYQNRVLRDELQRAQQTGDGIQLHPTDEIILDPPEDRTRNSAGQADKEELGDPFLDDGSGAAPDREFGELPAPPPPGQTMEAPGEEPLKDPGANSDQASGPAKSSGDESQEESIPLPTPDEKSGVEPTPDPQPPTADDQQVPPVIPGELQPPGNDDQPPGKIELPPGTKMLRYQSPTLEPPPEPDHLELHDGLSGGHQFDDDSDIDGLYLILTVADPEGSTLSLDDFEVDAALTVVVLDPNDTSDDPRVGRWDFTPDQVRELIRSAPVSGIHIPIAWQDRLPTGDDVIVHIRMAAAEEEMRCQGRLKLEESVAMSNWLPRG
ncbi:hypothetical protein FYK55_11470 [Roseiconus nitratireducens]|uniref:Uncharacterized protein n=1 Tax=Roseiconus nitratireducens TaxID=2605748 RepID=A0A5M6D8B4_9BACT|nr:hypothetical protein [Roseiconus nitratireducens]KAA5543788.1 hypothetical protein FYK55_11470 [Roseiconus nitratireducens]